MPTHAKAQKTRRPQREEQLALFAPQEPVVSLKTTRMCFLCENPPGQVGTWPRCPVCGGTAAPGYIRRRLEEQAPDGD